jgi:hypothetical protein
MSFKEFYKEDISKYGKDIPDTSRPVLYAGDMEGMADDLKPYKTINNIKLYDNGEGIIAKIGDKEVGFILKMGDETDLNVAKEFQQKGIGTILGKEFWEKYPEHRKLTGGFTSLGKKVFSKVMEKK